MQIRDRGIANWARHPYTVKTYTNSSGLSSNKLNYLSLQPFLRHLIWFFKGSKVRNAEVQFTHSFVRTYETTFISQFQRFGIAAFFVGATGIIYGRGISPCEAQSSIVNEKGPVIYATKNITKGSLFRVADLTKSEIDQAKIPGKALPSALLIVGRRARNNLIRGQLIYTQDIDFHPRLSKREKILANREMKIARSKWSAPSDVSWDKWTSQQSKSEPAKESHP